MLRETTFAHLHNQSDYKLASKYILGKFCRTVLAFFRLKTNYLETCVIIDPASIPIDRLVFLSVFIVCSLHSVTKIKNSPFYPDNTIKITPNLFCLGVQYCMYWSPKGVKEEVWSKGFPALILSQERTGIMKNESSSIICLRNLRFCSSSSFPSSYVHDTTILQCGGSLTGIHDILLASVDPVSSSTESRKINSGFSAVASFNSSFRKAVTGTWRTKSNTD